MADASVWPLGRRPSVSEMKRSEVGQSEPRVEHEDRFEAAVRQEQPAVELRQREAEVPSRVGNLAGLALGGRACPAGTDEVTTRRRASGRIMVPSHVEPPR